jgi:methylenetetrahydrofolate--tRNA-(uracil-5-)-methyltransferase
MKLGKNNTPKINIIGSGLAGSEAALQLAKRGFEVHLYEMKPLAFSEAHKSEKPAELVCSNTFKSISLNNAHGIFKKELLLLECELLEIAKTAQVPAGEALAVDREVFSENVLKKLNSFPNIIQHKKIVQSLEELDHAFATVIATGPLTFGMLSETIKKLTGGGGLYFYDAIAPIVLSESIDMTKVFKASRYQKGEDDYINCPMDKETYLKFYNELIHAEKVELHDFEDAKYFQGCQPIEAIAEKGVDSLRFGPMKPVGLIDPKTGKKPYAVVQLRIDNLSQTAYNMVGFQTKLKYNEQKRVFSLIPGLENAEFLRLGSIHRNTYINSPLYINDDLSFKPKNDLYFAGQISGVEGYTESISSGLLCALSITARYKNKNWQAPKRETFLGSLIYYLKNSDPKNYQPFNVHFGILDYNFFDSFKKSLKTNDKKILREAIGQYTCEKIMEWKQENHELFTKI